MGRRKSAGGGDPLLYQRRVSSSEVPLHIAQLPRHRPQKIYTRRSEFRRLIRSNSNSSISVVLPKKLLEYMRKSDLEAFAWSPGDDVEISVGIDDRRHCSVLVIAAIPRDSKYDPDLLHVEIESDRHRMKEYEPRKRPAGRGKKS